MYELPHYTEGQPVTELAVAGAKISAVAQFEEGSSRSAVTHARWALPSPASLTANHPCSPWGLVVEVEANRQIYSMEPPRRGQGLLPSRHRFRDRVGRLLTRH